jgi:hypothetical protein
LREAHKAQFEGAERRLQAAQRETEAAASLLHKKEAERALMEEKLNEERRRCKAAQEAAWAMEGEKGEWTLERRALEEEVGGGWCVGLVYFVVYSVYV